MRNGQVFYIYNRVESIESVAKRIADSFPDAVIKVAHGKLSREDMEKIFYEMSLGNLLTLPFSCSIAINKGILFFSFIFFNLLIIPIIVSMET